MAAPAREVIVERSTQRLTSTDHVQRHSSSVVEDGLEVGERETKGQRKALKHAEEKREKGGTGDDSLALEGAGAHIFICFCGHACYRKYSKVKLS